MVCFFRSYKRRKTSRALDHDGRPIHGRASGRNVPWSAHQRRTLWLRGIHANYQARGQTSRGGPKPYLKESWKVFAISSYLRMRWHPFCAFFNRFLFLIPVFITISVVFVDLLWFFLWICFVSVFWNLPKRWRVSEIRMCVFMTVLAFCLLLENLEWSFYLSRIGF